MATSSVLKFGRHASGHLVCIQGKGIARTSPALRKFVDLCLEEDDETVVVDLNACQYLDSTMLGCLVGLHRRHGRGQPARFVVAANDDARQRLLTATHVDQFLQLVETAPAAIGELIDITVKETEPDDLGQHIMQCHRQLAALGGPGAEAFARIADRLEQELKQSDSPAKEQP